MLREQEATSLNDNNAKNSLEDAANCVFLFRLALHLIFLVSFFCLSITAFMTTNELELN